jgi:DNA-binding response OmpR family regulator
MAVKRSTILIIDSDLGSVFWLGHLLDSSGCESLPAKSLSDAKALLDDLKITVDLLILRCSIPGAAAFADDLRWSQGHLKTIGLLADDERISEGEPRMDAWLQKPLQTDDASKSDYLDLINWALVKNTLVPPVLPAAVFSGS